MNCQSIFVSVAPCTVAVEKGKSKEEFSEMMAEVAERSHSGTRSIVVIVERNFKFYKIL